MLPGIFPYLYKSRAPIATGIVVVFVSHPSRFKGLSSPWSYQWADIFSLIVSDNNVRSVATHLMICMHLAYDCDFISYCFYLVLALVPFFFCNEFVGMCWPCCVWMHFRELTFRGRTKNSIVIDSTNTTRVTKSAWASKEPTIMLANVMSLVPKMDRVSVFIFSHNIYLAFITQACMTKRFLVRWLFINSRGRGGAKGETKNWPCGRVCLYPGRKLQIEAAKRSKLVWRSWISVTVFKTELFSVQVFLY